MEDLIFKCDDNSADDMLISGMWDVDGDLLIAHRGKKGNWSKSEVYYSKDEVHALYHHLHKLLYENK